MKMLGWSLPLQTAILLVLIAFFAGCSAFQGSRIMDMAPFAENTTMLFAEAEQVNRQGIWDNIKPYLNIEEMKALSAKGTPVRNGLRGIVMYSNQLVALNMSDKKEKEKNRLLARYLKDAFEKVANPRVMDSIGISRAQLDTVLSNIEGAKSYREGIEAASPLVNAVVVAMQDELKEILDMIPEVVAGIENRVESEYATQRQNYRALVRLQARLHRCMTLLYEGHMGNRDSLRVLSELDSSIKELCPSPERMTSSEFKLADDMLTKRLERVDAMVRQLDEAKSSYSAKLKELDLLRVNLEERLRIARDAIMIWAQSHRNLGAGIAVPPLIDVGGIASGLARKIVP
jgi:signal transduction histidine kinase